MAITFNVQPGYQFSASERVTYSKLNLLGTPTITLDGTVDSNEITDGAVVTSKLADSIDINSKIDDHNLALTKLAQGTHGQILYYNAEGDLVTLAPGTDGYFLSTAGAGADPVWKSAVTGTGIVPYSSLTTNGLGDQYLTTDSSGNIEWIAKPETNSADVYTSPDAETVRGLGSHVQSIGYTPEQIRVTLLCETSDTSTGYVSGDELEIGHNFWSDTNENRNAVLVIYDDASQSVRIQFEGNGASSYRIQHKTTGATVNTSAAILGNFAFKIRTWDTGAGSSASNNAGPLTSEPGYYYEEESSSTLDTIYTGRGPKQVFSHGLGVVPRLTRVVLKFTDAVTQLPGYVAGDEVDIGSLMGVPAGGALEDRSYNAAHIINNSSGVTVQFSMAAGVLPNLTISNPSNGELSAALTGATMAKMKLKVYAWK